MTMELKPMMSLRVTFHHVWWKQPVRAQQGEVFAEHEQEREDGYPGNGYEGIGTQPDRHIPEPAQG